MQITKRTRLTAVLSLVIALALALPLAPASASAAGVFTVAGEAILDDGIPSSGNGCFNGLAVGAHGTAPVAGGGVTADFSYDNELAALGFADGTLTVSGLPTVGFSWIRVGLTAVVTLGTRSTDTHSGAAVAAFAPHATVDNPVFANRCSGNLHAAVVGVGVVTPA